MHLSAEQTIAAPRHVVWQGLNDPEILKRCVPGCEVLERVGDDELLAEVVAKVGPVKARFKGRLQLSDMDPPRSYRIAGEGQGGAAGFAKGGAVVVLEEAGEKTILRYDVTASVGGKLAQIGSRLIDAAARKFAEDFFARFSAAVTPAAAMAAPAAASAPIAAAEGEEGVRPVIWVPALIVIVLLVLFFWAAASS
jgi:carbon monoxide dehydrogenase subunit G